MNKDEIRSRVKASKSLLSASEKSIAAAAVFGRLEQSAAFTLAENILLYHSLPDELSTREFLERWSGRKHFFLPRVNGLNLEILPYEQSRMALGAFHIEEPTGDDTADISQIELVVVPPWPMTAVATVSDAARGITTACSPRPTRQKSESDMISSCSTRRFRPSPMMWQSTSSSPRADASSFIT